MTNGIALELAGKVLNAYISFGWVSSVSHELTSKLNGRFSNHLR
jgi:hypothetical protein